MVVVIKKQKSSINESDSNTMTHKKWIINRSTDNVDSIEIELVASKLKVTLVVAVKYSYFKKNLKLVKNLQEQPKQTLQGPDWKLIQPTNSH